MTLEQQITDKLRQHFQPEYLELLNESHMHAGPATDSHFNLILVSDSFSGLSRVKRHQAIYRVLADEMAGPIHALALHLHSPQEWQKQSGNIPASPECSNK